MTNYNDLTIFGKLAFACFVEISAIGCHLPHLGKPIGEAYITSFPVYKYRVVVLVVADVLRKVVQVVLLPC